MIKLINRPAIMEILNKEIKPAIFRPKDRKEPQMKKPTVIKIEYVFIEHRKETQMKESAFTTELRDWLVGRLMSEPASAVSVLP
jgi:hypothetical protein